MSALPPGGLKVATTIPIETAEADNGDELKKATSYSFSLPLSETFQIPVVDPEQTFQALLNVREVVRKKTLNALKVTLVSGEDGVVGAAYEGNWRVREASTLSRLTIVKTENVAEYKRLELSVLHTNVSNAENSAVPETWTFEIQQDSEGTWLLVFNVKYDVFSDKLLSVLCCIPVLLNVIVVGALAVAGFPITILLVKQRIEAKKQQTLPLWRYVLGIEGPNRPKPSQQGRQPAKQVISRKEPLTETDELAKLFVLFKAGALTKEEFELQKGKIIGV